MIPNEVALPRRYFVDHTGQRVLIGLTREETSEFEHLDALGQHAVDRPANRGLSFPEKMPSNPRWSELYRKHDCAWRYWLSESKNDDQIHSLLTRFE